MELSDELRKNINLLLDQIALIKDDIKREEIIKNFVEIISIQKKVVDDTVASERKIDIDSFLRHDDGIRKTPSRKRNFTEREKQILNQYLNSIREVSENTEEENRKLYTLMQSNNIIERTKAREDLIKGNMKIALRFLCRVTLSYIEVTNLEDLINEVNIDLVRTANYYNPEMGSFNNLLFFNVRRAISNCLEVGNRSIEVPQHLNKASNEIIDSVLTDEEIISKNNISAANYNKFKNALNMINMDDELSHLSDDSSADYELDSSLIEPNFEDHVLDNAMISKEDLDEMFYWLSPKEEEIIRKRFGLGCDKMTTSELAKQYRETTERIRQIEKKALRKIKFTPIAYKVRRSMR